jgi:AraC-like DNA-binding protein
MDVLDDVLAQVRGSGAAFCRTIATPPWGLNFIAPAELSLVCMLHGSAWIVQPDSEPIQVGEGDIVLIRTGTSYLVADQADSGPIATVDGNYRCTLSGGGGNDERSWRVAGRTLGEPRPQADADLLVSANYHVERELSVLLLDVLPAAAKVERSEGIAPLLSLIEEEIDHDRPGQQVVLDRLLDLVLVRTLRAWFDGAAVHLPVGYRALSDPGLGHVLRRIHEDPAYPWTVAELAQEAGMASSTFSRRFTGLVGFSPLQYVTRWRMDLAADRLLEPGATVGAVASGLGYSDGFAFSAAFKRNRGISPSAYRSRGGLKPN